MESLVNAVIARDVEELTGWNWLATSESILRALEINWFSLVSDPLIDALKTVAVNLDIVYRKYFIWTEASGKSPISVYTYIYQNWTAILNELTDGLAIDLIDDPLSYEVRIKLELKFKDFAGLLLQVGNIHKFNREFIEENIFPEEDGEE